ncbi:hypothetical protein BVRB_1g001660 [Beta vulgaris subsp. vulgaris]|nr:hypothetical protein BVRB_1g001660 [Beta vulgaris subsp. vulgaris]
MFDRNLLRGMCKPFLSPVEAIWELFELFRSPLLIPPTFGGLETDKPHRFPGYVDVEHGSRDFVVFYGLQGATMCVQIVVLPGWDVILTMAFIPSSNVSYTQVLLHERQEITAESLGEDNKIERIFTLPEDGRIEVTMENMSFSKKKMVYLCIVQLG